MFTLFFRLWYIYNSKESITSVKCLCFKQFWTGPLFLQTLSQMGPPTLLHIRLTHKSYLWFICIIFVKLLWIKVTMYVENIVSSIFCSLEEKKKSGHPQSLICDISSIPQVYSWRQIPLLHLLSLMRWFVVLFIFPLIQISSFCQRLKEKAVYTAWVR